MQENFQSSPKLEDLELSEIPKIFNKQRDFFNSGVTRDIKFRLQALDKLKNAMMKFEDRLNEAIYHDMGRPAFETYGAEIGNILQEIRHNKRNLKKWAKSQKIRAGFAHFGAQTHIDHIPRGVSLIVGSFNYPILMCLLPLVSSISAGNTAIIKPSEFPTHTAVVIDELIEETFEKGYIDIIPGGIETAQTLLTQGFDIILFTGSERVGRIYAEAAAKTLTPIILEMGGKSPTIIDKTAKLDQAVERILFGKFFNAAQTCVAPDYIYIHEDVKNDFIELSKSKIEEFYGKSPQNSKDFARIINIGHFNRIKNLIETTSGQIVYGGTTDEEDLFIEPTLIDSPPMTDEVMKQEIFGPVLPIITWKDEDEIAEKVNINKNPLAMYIFSRDRGFIKKMRTEIPAGDIGINEVAYYFAVAGMKVGGIRNSGLGAYRGRVGFESFSHKQSVYKKTTWFQLPFIKPPYNKFKTIILRVFMR